MLFALSIAACFFGKNLLLDLAELADPEPVGLLYGAGEIVPGFAGGIHALVETLLVLDGIGAWYIMGRTLSTEQTAEVVNVAQVSEDFFSVLKTAPLLPNLQSPI